MGLSEFAAAVGPSGPVTVTGLGTRGGPVAGATVVRAPGGIEWIAPDEMTVSCGAGLPVDELDAALAERGQFIALPPGGTVGGALAVGHSSIRRLGYGPVRDAFDPDGVANPEKVLPAGSRCGDLQKIPEGAWI